MLCTAGTTLIMATVSLPCAYREFLESQLRFRRQAQHRFRIFYTDSYGKALACVEVNLKTYEKSSPLR
jgi:hypothetical protein